MKNLLIPAICIIFTFCSCGKKSTQAPANPVPAKGIYATIDGKSRAFNYNDSISVSHNNFYQLAVTGYTAPAPGDTTIVFGFGISSSTPLTTGTYTLHDSPIVIYLYDELTAPNSYFYEYAANASSVYASSITITAISSNNIQGTFSGTFINVGASSGNIANLSVITNGKFNLDYTQ